ADGILGGTRDGSLVLYNYEGRELRRALLGKAAVDFVAFAGEGRAISMSEDLVLRCVDLATGRELWKEEYFRLGDGPYRFHPDGRHVLGNQEDERQQRRQVVRFDASTGRVVQTYGKFDGYVAGIGVSGDGALVAASGRDGPLAVWE